MPQSKTRHAHKHPSHPPRPANLPAKPKHNNRVIVIAVLFFGVLGLAIGYFIGGTATVLLTSAILGAAAGFIFGYSIKKSLQGK